MQIFSKNEAVKTGWSLMKTNLGIAVILYAIYLGVLMAISLLQAGVEHMLGKGLLSYNIMIVSYLLSFLLIVGMIKIFLNLYDGKKVEIIELFTNFDQYFNYLACYLLVALIVLGGLILFIVPGIIWALKYQFATYLVIDKKMKPLEAIKKSARLTYGHKMNLFLFVFVALGITIIGFLCCCVGLIPAGIVVFFAYIHIYRKLLADYEEQNKFNTGNPVSENGPACDSIPSLESVAQNPENPVKTEEPKTPENL